MQLMNGWVKGTVYDDGGWFGTLKGDDFSLSFTSEKTRVKPGEEISYAVKISNVTASSGINMVEFYLGDYDSSKFDCQIRNYDQDKFSLINKDGYITITSQNAEEVWKTDTVLANIIYIPKTGIENNTYNVPIKKIRVTKGDNSTYTSEYGNILIPVENINYSCNFIFTPDKNSVKPGEEITYEVKLANINAGNGLKMVEFYIGDYDSSKFECKIRNYNEDKWTLINRDGYITISLNNSESWNTDEILARIIYTTKVGVADGTYQTKIKNIRVTAEDKNIVPLAESILNIKVQSDLNTKTEPTNNNNSANQGNNIVNNSTNKDSSNDNNSSKTSSESKNNTSSENKSANNKSSSENKNTSNQKSTSKSNNSKLSLPYSGDMENIIIITGIFLFSGLAIFLYIRYKRLNIQ